MERVREEQPELPPARSDVVPAGVRLLPLVARPEPVDVTARQPRVPYRWDRIKGRLVDVEEPAGLVIPKITGVDPWADKFPYQTTIGQPPQVTNAVPAETGRQVVTEVITLTPAELRRKARALNKEAVRSNGRPVTIKTLQDELGLSRREATDLRREVVGGERS